MPNMEDSEADASLLPAASPKKSAPHDAAQCSPVAPANNVTSPSEPSTPAAASLTAKCVVQSADSMPPVESMPHGAGHHVVDHHHPNALAGTKRKKSKDDRPTAKKARSSIDLENKQELPSPMPIPIPSPTSNPSESKANIPPDPIHAISESDQVDAGDHVFHFEYDEYGYGDDADRENLLKMSDAQRKAELDARLSRRAEMKLVWESNQKAVKFGEAQEGKTDDNPVAAPEISHVDPNAESEETVEKEEKDAKVGDSSTTPTSNAGTAPLVARPIIRSRPISTTTKDSAATSRASPTKSKDTTTTSTTTSATTTATTTTTTTGMKKERSNKKRNVSWAKDDDLVQVVSIDSRMELIKSWDPESEITLPFTSLTLFAFRQAIAAEADNAAERANPGTTTQSDAFAPGNEPDNANMDEERRRREYKAARQRKLDEMQPTIEWPRKGTQVVLPPECKPEPVTVKFTLHLEMDDGEVSNTEEHDSSYSPRSPPPEDEQYGDAGAYEIPWTDPSVPRKVEMHQEQNVQQVPQQHNPNTFHSNGTGGVPQLRSQPHHHHHAHASYHQNQQQHQPYQQDMDMRGDNSGGYNHNHQERSPPQQQQQQHYQHPSGLNGGPVPQHMMNNNGYPGNMAVPEIPSVDLQSLLQAIRHQQGPPPPPPPPTLRDGMAPPGYSNGQGQYYPVQMAPVQMAAPGHARAMDYGLPPPQLAQKLMSGRTKIKKKCKYFGTKQGCRDGPSCMFSHAP